jgi:hypothetical protein
MSKAGFYLNRTTDPDVESLTGDTGGAVTPDAAGNISILGGNGANTVGAPGSNSITLNVNDGVILPATGFESWDGGAPYYDDTTLGSFTVSQSGTGYIYGDPVTWTAPQTVTGLVAGTLYWIYIDSTGTIQKTSTFSESLYKDNIVLFECLRDSTAPTNNQLTVKENHPYDFQPAVSVYTHRALGTIIENMNNGANITLNGTQKIEIVGTDYLSDHGLRTTISDSGGVAETWNKVYTNGSGKWALYNSNDTFLGVYNNAGTVTALGANKYGVYRLYASKDDLNSTTPVYFAVIGDAQYNNQTLAETAISNDSVPVISNELAGLELTQLGYIIFEESSSSISEVIIEKETIRSVFTGGASTVASLITTTTTNFDHILSAADTTVQAALETIDDLILRADGPTDAQASSAVFTIAGGSNINTSAAASTVTVDLVSSPSVSGSVTAGTGFSATTGDVDIVAGNLTLPATNAGGTQGTIVQSSKTIFHSQSIAAGASNNNTFFGEDCGTLALGAGSSGNTFFGFKAADSIITGGRENTGFGNGSLKSLTSGDFNSALGSNSGSITTGSYNLFLGNTAGSAYTTSESSNIALMNQGTISESHVTRIGTQGSGNGQQNKCYIAGITSTATGATTEVVQVDANGQLGTTSATTINMSNDATAASVNIATGAAAKVTTIGSTNGASQLALQYGTADFTVASASGTVIQALDSGEVTNPLQPRFRAYVSSDILNVTGDGSSYSIVYDTESYDIGSDFDTSTGIFTAPVDGLYLFTVSIFLEGLLATHTRSQCSLNISGGSVGVVFGISSSAAERSDLGSLTYSASTTGYMSSGDTAYVNVVVLNGAKSVDIGGNAGGGLNVFTGTLLS